MVYWQANNRYLFKPPLFDCCSYQIERVVWFVFAKFGAEVALRVGRAAESNGNKGELWRCGARMRRGGCRSLRIRNRVVSALHRSTPLWLARALHQIKWIKLLSGMVDIRSSACMPLIYDYVSHCYRRTLRCISCKPQFSKVSYMLRHISQSSLVIAYRTICCLSGAYRCSELLAS